MTMARQMRRRESREDPFPQLSAITAWLIRNSALRETQQQMQTHWTAVLLWYFQKRILLPNPVYPGRQSESQGSIEAQIQKQKPHTDIQSQPHSPGRTVNAHSILRQEIFLLLPTAITEKGRTSEKADSNWRLNEQQ